MIHTYPFSLHKNDFKIKRKRYTCKGDIYPISYNNSDFIVQTPTLFIPFGLKYNSIIDVSLNDTDERAESFKQFIGTIETILESTPRFKSYILRKSIFYNLSNYPKLMRLYYSKDILIFNEKKYKIGKSFLEPKSFCKFILHIKHVWRQDIRFGLEIKISQILCVNTTYKPKQFSFIEEKKDNVNDDSTISKYKKMLKMNIPLQAVKNKMILDGIDPDLLDKKKPITNKLNNTLLFDIKNLKRTNINCNDKHKTEKSNSLPFLKELMNIFLTKSKVSV